MPFINARFPRIYPIPKSIILNLGSAKPFLLSREKAKLGLW